MTLLAETDIKNNHKLLSDTLSSVKGPFTRDDLLKYYYFPFLQKFINGEIKDLSYFFSVTPGRFLLRFLMDRFSYHTDKSSNISETFYCCDGKDYYEKTKSGKYAVKFLVDKDSEDQYDFLGLSDITDFMSHLKDASESIKKCDRCLHRYYCGLPCSSLLKEFDIELNYPEDRCYITQELFKWYENHLNSILKIIYSYSNTHSVKFEEDKIYQKIVNDRLNSKYFDINLDNDKYSDYYNSICVRVK